MPDLPTPTELITALPPELMQRLIKVASEVERGKILDSQYAALSLENKERVTRNRMSFRDKHQDAYSTFDWKSALLGAPGHEYAFKLMATTFYLRPPAAKVTRAAQAMASSEAGTARQPITAEEYRLLGWLSAVQRDGSPRTDFGSHGKPEAQLDALRQLPDVLLTRVAFEAENLETWLNVQLELDGGNS